MIDLIGNSWKDEVRRMFESRLEKSAAMTATNDDDIEKAFADQASGFIENKLGALMKDDNRIGFEIVKKNDDNTRMVGVFAFKIDKDVVFAPVFFLNGEIKGPLLYRCNTKTFVPANKEWANYLLESVERKEGEPRSRTKLKDSPPRVHMDRITFRPQGTNKSASSCECDCDKKCVEGGSCDLAIPAIVKSIKDINGEYVIEKQLGAKPGEQPKLSTGMCILKCAFTEDGRIKLNVNGREDYLSEKEEEAILKSAGNSVPVEIENVGVEIPAHSVDLIRHALEKTNENEFDIGDADLILDKMFKSAGVLREVMEMPGLGKYFAETIIKTASDSRKFANALSSCYADPKDLFPEVFTDFEKKASADDSLSIVYDIDLLEKKASTEQSRFFGDGFYILDKRPTDGLTYVDESYDTAISAASHPGVYKILNSNGSFRDDVFVAPIGYTSYRIGSSRNIAEMDYCNCEYMGHGDYNRSTPKVAIIHNGKVSVRPTVYGIQTGKPESYGSMSDSPESGNVYLIYLDGKVTTPIRIQEVKSVDGVKKCTVNGSYDFDTSFYTKDSGGKTLIVNPDIDKTDFANGVIGKDAKWIKLDTKEVYENSVKPESIDDLGDTACLDKWIYETFGTTNAVLKSYETAEKSAAYVIGNEEGYSDPMNKCVMLVKLARDLNIHADKAYELLEKADKEGTIKFTMTTKEASYLRLAERPQFDDEFDSEFGVPLQPARQFHLKVEGQQVMEQPSSIGDMLDPTSPTGLPNLTVATTAPEELRSLADTYKLPNVFEHAAIGTLADTFNAEPLVTKCISKLEDAVDSLGRLKFLIYWCPNDFENSYGSDDMTNLEAEISSNFDDLGSLYLKLIKKSEKNKRVDVSFGDL